MPWCRELASLTSLASALAPMLQQFMSRATLLQDTSMFLEETLAQQCLHGGTPSGADCTGLDACSSGAESEWEDFDMSAYMDLSPQRRSFSDDKLEPCESLVGALSWDARFFFALTCGSFHRLPSSAATVGADGHSPVPAGDSVQLCPCCRRAPAVRPHPLPSVGGSLSSEVRGHTRTALRALCKQASASMGGKKGRA